MALDSPKQHLLSHIGDIIGCEFIAAAGQLAAHLFSVFDEQT